MSLSTLVIESLDQEGRGVAHREGKVIFVEGALTGETVECSSWHRKPSYEIATVTRVLIASSARVTPRCPSFGVCGGCSMQHLEPRSQVAVKQRVLEDNLWHLARLRPEVIYRPVHGPSWGYRLRARLSVREVPRKGVLVGFHERRRSWIADMRGCDVLAPKLGLLLPQLRELISALSIRRRLPQIEYAEGAGRTALVLRVLEPPSAADEDLLREFAQRHEVDFWLQPRGPDSATPFAHAAVELSYELPEFGLRMPFRPTDFTQVNQQINRVLVERAVRLLDPQPHERVADLFCGLGNFSLAMARSAGHVVGVEGSAALLARARANATANGLAERTSFIEANLFEFTLAHQEKMGAIDRMLIDPPREGALTVARTLAASADGPRRIVYVSCNPATLARDAAILVHQGGYRLLGAGVINMFPHTSHVESIALLERAPR